MTDPTTVDQYARWLSKSDTHKLLRIVLGNPTTTNIAIAAHTVIWHRMNQKGFKIPDGAEADFMHYSTLINLEQSQDIAKHSEV